MYLSKTKRQLISKLLVSCYVSFILLGFSIIIGSFEGSNGAIRIEIELGKQPNDSIESLFRG